MKKILLGAILAISIVLVGFNINNIMGVPSKYFKEHAQVTATVYRTTYGKTGVTADGTKIRKKNAKELKLIAVSPDMLKKWPLGTHVLVVNADSLSGLYVVRDIMNKRFHNRIDILINKKDKLNMFKKAHMFKVDDAFFASN